MASDAVVIRLPRTSYLIIVFLLAGSIPIAFAGNAGSIDDPSAEFGVAGFAIGLPTLVLLIPLLVGIFVVRTGTVVSDKGLRVRALFGSRDLPWDSVRGLSVSGRGIYAVIADGAVRLPCVRIAHLGPISRLSAGRLPELPDVTPKPAAARRRR